MHLNRRLRARSLVALLAFLALALLLFWRLWAPNPADRMMIGPADGDFLRQFYPYRTFVAGAWGAGQVPLLNPHQYSGTPSWADPQQAVLYPWRLTQVPLAVGGRELPVWAVEMEAVAHIALAAWFTFLLLRALGANASASAFAGLTFGFGGYATGYPVEQLAVLDTAVWLPALLWIVTVALRRVQSRPAAAAVPWAFAVGAVAALMIFAGHPQTAMYGMYAAVVWWLARGWRERVPPRRLIGVGLIALLVAAGLSAAQWLPTAALSQRVARDLDHAELSAGMQAADIVQMVAPARLDVLASDAAARTVPQAGAPRGAGSWVPLFIGALALGLVLWGVWRQRSVRMWVGVAGVTWLISLGGNTFLYDLVVRWLPGFGLFRHQERIAVLFSLSLAVAAGLTVSYLLGNGRLRLRAPARLLAVLVALTALGAVAATASADSPDGFAYADALVISTLALAAGALVLYAGGRGVLSLRAVGWSLVVVAALELLSVNHGRALAPRTDDVPSSSDAIAATLSERSREGRVSSEALLPGGPNAASVLDMYDTTGDSPMQLARHAMLVEELPEMLAWRLQAVRFVVSDREFPPDAPVSEMATSGDAVLYEVQLPAPPVWVPERVEAPSISDGTHLGFGILDARSYLRFLAQDVDPGHVVYVPPRVAAAHAEAGGVLGAPGPADEGPPGTPSPATARGADDETAAGADDETAFGADAEEERTAHGEASLTALDPGRAVTDVELPVTSVVVLSTIYDPGWTAAAQSLNGAEGAVGLEVVPAYGVLTAALVPAGEWRIEWTYRPVEVEFGVALSCATLLLGAAWWLFRVRRKR
jgi:hypothetical protein